MLNGEFPLPPHFNPESAGKVWKVNFEERAKEARKWSDKYEIKSSARDDFKICLLIVDMQNTFCVPEYELFAAGRSGNGAVEDTLRLCQFIYKNLGGITKIIPTMDTHQPLQIFHPVFLINNEGEHPAPYTLISAEEISEGKWKVNPGVCLNLGIDQDYAEKYLIHYTNKLKEGGKYNLTVWPYHAMLGGIGHALVSPLEEALFFHSVARYSQIEFQLKGSNVLTEHYSVFGPEISTGADGEDIASKNTALIEELMNFDAVVIAGEAKSHCVAWTIEDLMREFKKRNEDLLKKIYLLDDCTSPVVIPGVIDYTDDANKAFERFAKAGMHVVKSTERIF